MTKDIKNILKATIKQYEKLIQYSNEEAQEVYMKVVNFLKELIEK